MILFNNPVQDFDLKNALESLNKGVDINTEYPGCGPLLHIAIRQKDLKTLELLIMRGADINKQNGAGETVLMIAVLWGHAGLVDYLLRNKADIGVTEFSNGRTALHLAVFCRNPKLVKLLLERDADYTYTIQDASNKTPEMLTSDPTIIKLFEERKALDLKIRAEENDKGSSSSARICKS